MAQTDFKICREYAAIDLIFSLYNIFDSMNHEDNDKTGELFGEAENGYYERLTEQLAVVLEASKKNEGLKSRTEKFKKAEKDLKDLRNELKKRMEYFSSVTDRLIAYEYVLNRLELTYSGEDELDRFLKGVSEDSFMEEVFTHLSSDKDKHIYMDKLQQLIGELPVQITKSKFFELIDHTMSLYLGTDETALDEFLYMIRMTGLIFEAPEYPDEYLKLKEQIKAFDDADLKNLDEKDYLGLKDGIFELSGSLQRIIDFYNDLQKCANDALSLCLVSKWLPEEDELIRENERNTIISLIEKKPDEELFVSFEGRIETVSDNLNARMSGIKAPDMNGEEEEEYMDLATLARLLSNSLYADIDPLFVESVQVTDVMLKEKEDELIRDFTGVLKGSPKPLRKAIMAKVMEKLPPFITSGEEIRDYIHINLFECRSKAEKCAVIAIIGDMMAGW
ncbi:MAG: hypothetical protein J6P16_04055 [Eubacterium sp.]|nr:hypothetical protein [Eubacterium sp.]